MANRLTQSFPVLAILLVALFAAFLVYAWHRSANRRPPVSSATRLEQIANELGSIAQFRQDLWPNSHGTALVFCQLTEKGIGIYFWDAVSDRKKQVCEQEEQGYRWPNRHCLLGWAPDDSLFACAYPPHDTDQPNEDILICSGTNGERLAALRVDTNLVEAAWLSSRSFVYSTSTKNLCLCGQKPDGTWIQMRTFEAVSTNQLRALVATSSNSVAWREGGEIWRADLTSGSRDRIWDSTTSRLEDLKPSDVFGELLLTCSDELGWFQLLFRPPTKEHPRGVTHELSRVAEDRPKYVIFREEAEYKRFSVRADADSDTVQLLWRGTIDGSQGANDNYVLTPDYFYVTGTLTNQPPGIWRLNLRKQTLRCIVPGSETPLKHARIVTPTGGTFLNDNGVRTYHLWKPPEASSGGRHPLILGQTPGTWLAYPHIAANANCYFAIVDRTYWMESALNGWKTDVMSLYQTLIKDPNVDTNRVFLYGQGEETAFLTELLAQRPELWNGAFLVSPGDLAKPASVTALSNAIPVKILIVAGTEDPGAVQRVTEYQKAASRAGASVEVVIQDGVQHVTKSIATERARAMLFAKFLSEILQDAPRAQPAGL
jgi:predicted esterase